LLGVRWRAVNRRENSRSRDYLHASHATDLRRPAITGLRGLTRQVSEIVKVA
jgi:hypothetical protein